MARIVKHGIYWREDIQRADQSALIKCPECDNKFLVGKYPCFELGMEAWCQCGCRFIPEPCDVIEDK